MLDYCGPQSAGIDNGLAPAVRAGWLHGSWHIEPVPDPICKMIEEVVDTHLPEPPGLPPALGVVDRDLRDPVDHRHGRPRIGMGDRIKDDSLAMRAEADEG